MIQDFQVFNAQDDNGNPTGGTAYSAGIEIHWQDGPLGIGADRMEPNGAFVETVIAIAKSRIEFFQESSHFACSENAEAIRGLNYALSSLELRTQRRTSEGVEGTHGPDRANREGDG